MAYDEKYLESRGWKSLPEGWKDPHNPDKQGIAFISALDLAKERDRDYLRRRGWAGSSDDKWVLFGDHLFVLDKAVAHQAARDEETEMMVWSSGYDAACVSTLSLSAGVKTAADAAVVAQLISTESYARQADNKLAEFRKRFGKAPGTK
jgi:hypothetical protein